MPYRYPPELRECAVRMVLEGVREGVYSSEWASIRAVAEMLGGSPSPPLNDWLGEHRPRVRAGPAKAT